MTARLVAALRRGRTRRLLAVAALATAITPAALLAAAGGAAAGSSIDVYAVKGGAAGVRVTVQTGYSFVVEPDVMIPRATAAIEADHVDALASPADPGDSVDALPGLGFPTAEQDIENGAATPNPLPPPFPGSGSPPPQQFTDAVDSVVSTFAATFNPTLTAPYLHAEAMYPNADNAPQRSAYPPAGPGNVPPQLPELPDFPDVFGLMSAHNSLGSAKAGPGSGVADSGEGSAVSIPALGLSIGRISAHVEMHGGNGGTATSSVVTTLHDIDFAPPPPPSVPGLPLPTPPSAGTLLHIGVLVLSATTQRAPGAAHATSHTSLEASGVSLAGQSARLDEHGFSINGTPNPALNGAMQQLIAALNSPSCQPLAPISVPGAGSLTSQPQMQIGTPQLQDQLSHNGNEDAVSMNGPTLCVATSAPIPGTNGVAATPTVYRITLGSVASSAYGVSLPEEGALNLAFSPSLSTTGGGGAGSVSNTTITNPGSSSSSSTAQGGAHPGGLRGLLATLTGGILSPPVVVSVASLAEIALLATLWLSYRLAGAPAAGDASPTTRMDLV